MRTSKQNVRQKRQKNNQGTTNSRQITERSLVVRETKSLYMQEAILKQKGNNSNLRFF